MATFRTNCFRNLSETLFFFLSGSTLTNDIPHKALPFHLNPFFPLIGTIVTNFLLGHLSDDVINMHELMACGEHSTVLNIPSFAQ